MEVKCAQHPWIQNSESHKWSGRFSPTMPRIPVLKNLCFYGDRAVDCAAHTADHNGIFKKNHEQSSSTVCQIEKTIPKCEQLSPSGLLLSVGTPCSTAAPLSTFLCRSLMAPPFYQAESYLWLRQGGPRAVSRACLFSEEEEKKLGAASTKTTLMFIAGFRREH